MRKLNYILCILLMAAVLSSCTAAQQETSEAAQSTSVITPETVQPSSASPSESVSTEPEEQIAESELSDTIQSPRTTDEDAEMHMTLKIGGASFTVELENNGTVAAFLERLPMTITMDELHGNEKYFYLDFSLPTDSAVPGRIEAGDVMLYGSDCLVVFYESFSTTYSYTPIGHITDTSGLKDALGSGSVSVELRYA